MGLQTAPVEDERFLPSGDEAGTAPGDRRFRPDVEGLRAVAVLLVVLYHAGIPGLSGGFVGVDVFFVISGFVITGLLLRERTSTGGTSILGFYARRVRRILPAATLVILVTVVFSYLLLGSVSGANVANDGRWAAVFLANFHFESIGTDYFTVSRPPSPLQNYWSLSVEEQFYIFFPTAFLLLARPKLRLSLRTRLCILLGLTIVASFWLSVAQTSSNPMRAYFSPFTRAWELALGALVAVCTPWLKKSPQLAAAVITWAGLAAIGWAAFAYTSGSPYPGSLVAVPVVGAAMVIAGGSAVPGAGAESLLATGPFQWMGRRSYSLYLWHWPVLIIAAERVGKTRLGVWESLALVLVALALSAITYTLVENPIRHLRTRPSATVGVGLVAVAATVLLLTLAISVDGTASSPSNKQVVPTSTEQSAVIAQVAAAAHISVLPPDVQPSVAASATDTALVNRIESPYCTAFKGASTAPICTVGDPTSQHLVVVLGDSHAFMWLPAFESIAKNAHWRLVVLNHLFCPAELVTVVNPPDWQSPSGPYAACDRWHKWTVAWINRHKPDMLVVSQENGGFYLSPAKNGQPAAHFTGRQWQDGLTSLLDSVTVPNIRKVVLGDIPTMSVYPPTCLGQHPDDVQACSSPSSTALSPFNAREADAAASAGAQYVNTIPWFCSAVCTAVIGRYIVYWDESHVTETYAKYLTLVLGEQLGI